MIRFYDKTKCIARMIIIWSKVHVLMRFRTLGREFTEDGAEDRFGGTISTNGRTDRLDDS